MSRYNAQKRLDIEQRAAAVSKSDAAYSKEESKLNVIMQDDPEMARLYKEAYGDIKAEKEHDFNEAQRIYDKYAYLTDKSALANKISTSLYDLNNERPTAEEELMTTEMSDEEADLLYKRYKILQSENTDSLRDIEEEA
jgi:hypothetical protein